VAPNTVFKPLSFFLHLFTLIRHKVATLEAASVKDYKDVCFKNDNLFTPRKTNPKACTLMEACRSEIELRPIQIEGAMFYCHTPKSYFVN